MSNTMKSFLDAFITGAPKDEIITDPLPPSERDVMAIDAAHFDADVCDDHDHSGDEKIGSCGNSCGGCPSKDTCASH